VPSAPTLGDPRRPPPWAVTKSVWIWRHSDPQRPSGPVAGQRAGLADRPDHHRDPDHRPV